MRVIFFLFIASFLLSNCTPKAASTKTYSPSLLHDIWVLSEFPDMGKDWKKRTVSIPQLEFFVSEERIVGYTGCNQLSGQLKSDDKNIDLNKLASTKKACENEVMLFENKFLTALNKVNRYEIKNLKLYLFENETLIMVLNKVD